MKQARLSDHAGPEGLRVQDAFESADRAYRATYRRRLLARCIIYPAAFVVVNGLFVLVCLALGFFHSIEGAGNGFTLYLRMGFVALLYCAWVYSAALALPRIFPSMRD